MLIVQDLKTKKRYWQSSTPGQNNIKPGQIIMKFGEQLRTSVIKEYQ
jgi:SPX domain protein involved in polyphosphate accumulation